jgi:hypothetical protein
LEGCDLHVQSEFGALPEASCACTFSCPSQFSKTRFLIPKVGR